MKTVTKRLPITSNTFQRLTASYEQRHSVNPLKKSREERYVIPRQCLLYILHKKYKQTSIHIGRLAGKDHATIIHSCKVLDNALYWRDAKYIEAINNWSEIFTEVLPNSEETKQELTDRITLMLLGTILSNDSKEEVLDMVKEKILNKNVQESDFAVI